MSIRIENTIILKNPHVNTVDHLYNILVNGCKICKLCIKQDINGTPIYVYAFQTIEDAVEIEKLIRDNWEIRKSLEKLYNQEINQE